MVRFRSIAAGAALLAMLAASSAVLSQPPAAGQGRQGGQGRGGRPPAPQPDGKSPVVKVANGQLQGVVYGDIAVYRDIPFAAPPVGDLRWRAPQPAKAWTGVRDAATAGATCAQAEDCLYANVHTPVSALKGAKLPVMVWIYGGAFTGGSGSQYDGNPFAKKGVVVVTFNYRLGRAGWYAHPALTKNAPAGEAVGNYGMQDQIAALKWVQKNVGAFSGDARNVTIFGESAGAQSVNYLMTLPQARGLFEKAISESGFERLEPKALDGEERIGAAYFKTLGIIGDSAATLKAMRAVSFSQLTGNLPLGASGVIRDGKLVKLGMTEAFAKGQEAKVPYMVGGNSNEASLLPTPNPSAAFAGLKTDREAMLAAFDPSHKGEAPRVVNGIVTDLQITEPDRNIARIHAKTGQPTFVYFFSYLPPAQRATSLGVGHGSEIAYVWSRAQGNPEDAATSQSASAYWTAFAKYGNPGAAGGPAWPKFEPKTEARLEFSVAGPRVVERFEQARLDWIEKNRDGVFEVIPTAAGSAPKPPPK